MAAIPSTSISSMVAASPSTSISSMMAASPSTSISSMMAASPSTSISSMVAASPSTSISSMVAPPPTIVLPTDTNVIGPLTTSFTAPSTCFDRITRANDGHIIVMASGSECLPPNTVQLYDRRQIFSPALGCPVSFTTVFNTTATYNQTHTVTRAICCPVVSGITAFSGRSMTYNSDGAGQQWYTTLGCHMAFASNTTYTVPTPGGLFAISPEPVATQTFQAPSVQIAWQSTDRIAQPSTNLPTSNIPISTISPSPLPPSDNADLSIGAKAAIGVLVPLVVIALIVGAVIFFKRRSRGQEYSSPSNDRDITTEGVGVHVMKGNSPVEVRQRRA